MTKNLTTVIAIVFLLAAGAGAALADGLARTNLGTSGLDWSLLQNVERTTLTVTGPNDFVLQQDFAGSSSPTFSIFSKSGNLLADGSYSWELSGMPAMTGEQRDAMAAQRGQGAAVKVPNMAQSGSFRIAGGALVVPGAEAAGASDTDLQTRDQVFLDDLIVDGSACIGQDCVNGESFGFDTLRLKENNLRIKFQDTSSSSSFPTNDWQITANDSANGGAEKFSIDDIDGGKTPFTILASAPSHSLYVNASGNVGLGTSTPVVELHVVDGDTPTLRLQQDGSSGFTPQTWDVAGNETNFFVRDVTNGSTLPFRIRPGAPESSIDIAATGNVGIGSTSPDSNLDIEGSTPGMRFTNTGTAGGGFRFQMNGSTGTLNWRDLSTNNDVVKIIQGGNANLLRVGSDGTGADAVNTVSIGSTNSGQEAVLDVRGSISVDGSSVHADYVFESDYDLASIEDQAAFMWQEKHLPSLPKAPEGLQGPVNLVSHQMGILEELEKAHIYIGQLNDGLKQKDSRIDELTQRLEKLEQLLLAE